MENVGVKSLCMLAAILYGVIGFNYTLSQSDQEVPSYLPSKTSGNFSFCDCSRKKSLLNFTALNISPDPIQFDKWTIASIKLNCQYVLAETISQERKIEVDINLRLKTPGKDTDLCELVGEEKCHYNDLMAALKKHGVSVPSELLEKGNHTIPNAEIPLDTLPFILRGTFVATLYVKQRGQHIGCLSMQFCVTECMFKGTQLGHKCELYEN